MSDAVSMVAALGGELVTYSPYGGQAKTFKALVERQPSEIAALAGVTYPENSLAVTFPRDATDGVLSIAKGKDRIAFKRHVSDSEVSTYTVVVVQQEDVGMGASDGGMWTVLVK